MDVDGEDTQQSTIDNYTGIAIKVREKTGDLPSWEINV